jgi:hypothetical protein
MLYTEDSMGHHGGEGVRQERDTVKSWSRVVEPFMLVDRFETCLGRVLRWPRPINGPREKGAASVTRIHSWVSDQ